MKAVYLSVAILVVLILVVVDVLLLPESGISFKTVTFSLNPCCSGCSSLAGEDAAKQITSYLS